MATYTIDVQGVNVQATVVSVASMVNTYIDELRLLCARNNRRPVVGLDIEWNPNSTYNKVATLRLCVGTRCLIIQLLYLDLVPQSLENFLADADICFVGVGINEDVNKIKKDYGLECNNVLELGPLAARVLGEPQLFKYGFEELAREVVRLNVKKPASVTCSDWGASSLSAEQIKFATIDAYASLSIGNALLG